MYTHEQIATLAGAYADDIIDTLLDGGGDLEGLCIECGETAYSVEPDARGYTCECCGASAVFGLEELILYIQA